MALVTRLTRSAANAADVAAATPLGRTPQPTAWAGQRRHAHDLVLKGTSGRPIIRSGPEGRHASTGHVATVFGASGFLGRYVVQKLARQGTQVVVPYRDQDEVRFLRPTGDLGQIVPMELDLLNDNQIEECVRHSDIVYNLIGRDYETKNYKFHNVHVEGARRIARISSLSGVSRLVHVSHISADHRSPSSFLRSKAEGEHAVKEAFSGATLVKPGPMWGHEDRLLQSVATEVKRWRYNNGETVIRPVAVTDVAEALKRMMDAESTIGQTFSLVGPKSYSHEQLVLLVEQILFKQLKGRPPPHYLSLAAAGLIERLVWWPTFAADRIRRQFISDKAPAPGTLGFEELGIEPETLEEVAIIYLRMHRSSTYADSPIASGGYDIKPRKYHVAA